jgi:phage-related baseplate assembly protein
MAIKTFAEIVSDMQSFIQQKQPNATTIEGTVLNDLVIEGIANEISLAYSDIQAAGESQSVVFANTLSTADMDNLAANFNLTRKPAQSAVGFVTFSSFTKPAADIQIGAADGSGGIVVSTRTLQDGSVIQFVTTQTAFLFQISVKNPNTGTYDVTIPVSAVSPGAAGNVGSSTIVVLQQAIPGINAVSNPLATSGGTDQESNTDLANRIIASAQARNLGTKSGYRSLVLSQTGIQDASVVGPNDPEAVRNQHGGEVDIYILGTNPTQSVMITNFFATNLNYIIDSRPVLSVISLTGLSNSTPFTFTQNIDYVFNQDISSVFEGSVQSLDAIQFTIPGAKPDDGSLMNVTYIYDKNIVTTQALLDEPDNDILTSDVLVKEAKEVIIDIGFIATSSGGSNPSDVLIQIIDVLSQIIDTTGLGARIDQSNLVFQIRQQVTAVSSITLPFTNLSIRGSGGGSNQFLQADLTQYFRLDQNSLSGITVN